jgi:glycerol-3-phosphate acyltransferase PlsY
MIWGILLFGFALGSIPFGYLIAKAKGVDIRSVGSGNIGTTNVFRALGKGPAIAVFILDVLKGLIPALLARKYVGSQEAAFACGFAAILGHSFSPFLGFKGGKGIATGLGMLLGATPLVACSAFATFAFVAALTLFVSAGSIASGIGALVFGFVFHDPTTLLYAYAVLAIYIFMRHRPNVTRILAGTEPKFGVKADDPGSAWKARLGFAGLGTALVAVVVASHVLK